jgi:glycerol kinase
VFWLTSRQSNLWIDLPVGAYFSGAKIKWILDKIPEGRKRANQGDLGWGRIDTWLVWNLTRGIIPVIDYSNASRTMLFNVNTLQWDTELLQMLGIPDIILPQVLPSSLVSGETAKGLFDNSLLPIAGVAGDQQASLFGYTKQKNHTLASLKPDNDQVYQRHENTRNGNAG